jgi:Holliday junction resolvase-like predicted endonuclease
MATDYLVRHRLTERPCRFDVVAIDLTTGEAGPGSGRPEVTIYRNAFDA